MKIYGKTILITGGTSGIGKALVDQLAPHNKAVIVLGRNPMRLDKIAKEYPNVKTYCCSLANKKEVENTISEMCENHPDISVVINNAGVQFTPTLLDKDFCFDSIENEITINLMAPIWISALMLDHLLNQKASAAFINITSGLALFPKKNSAVYCATKAGLRNFSKSFGYQLEETLVTVHDAIMPLVDTPMTEGRGKAKMSVDAAARAIIAGVESGAAEIYIGKARLMPLMARISPSLMGAIIKSS